MTKPEGAFTAPFSAAAFSRKTDPDCFAAVARALPLPGTGSGSLREPPLRLASLPPPRCGPRGGARSRGLGGPGNSRARALHTRAALPIEPGRQAVARLAAVIDGGRSRRV